MYKVFKARNLKSKRITEEEGEGESEREYTVVDPMYF